jgi:osmoprotectant transport system substrate-binding protein
VRRCIKGRSALCLCLVLLSGCVRSTPSRTGVLADDSLTVGSFDFPESVLLAELYAQALEAQGINVDRELALGPRELVMPALQRGLLEVVPEYTGSALAFFGEPVPREPDKVVARLQVALGKRDLRSLVPAAAEDQNGFVVTKETATELGLRRLSDLGRFASRLRFGGPPECRRRPLCLGGLVNVYGLRFAHVVTLDAGGPLTLQALHNDLVDVALVFTSDAALSERGLVLLLDDRHLQPPEQIVPVVHARSFERFGTAARGALNAVSSELTTRSLRVMNAAVAAGRTPADVARRWLQSRGIVTTD